MGGLHSQCCAGARVTTTNCSGSRQCRLPITVKCTLTTRLQQLIWFVLAIVGQLLARRKYNMFVNDNDEEDVRATRARADTDSLPLLR
jgi:hypothetical protein